MFKKLFFISLFISQISFFAIAKTVVIILPIEHQALSEIVAGFKEKLHSETKLTDIKIVVKNALGDINIQRTIIQQAKDQNVDLIVPVGTSTSQMTAAMTRKIPVVAMASLPIQAKNLTGVNDEISVDKPYQLMQLIKPNMKKLSVLYTPQDKNFDELKKLKTYTSHDHIDVHQTLIPNLTELYANVKSVPKDSDFMFIFKDNLIASGITVLINEAKLDKIPLMTSDEGTVSKGACFALAVKEKQIGEQSAELASKILNLNTPPSDLPFESIKKLSVFRNKKACDLQGLKPNLVSQSAKKLTYTVIDLN